MAIIVLSFSAGWCKLRDTGLSWMDGPADALLR
jgi:hypothetical protein